ncbi:MAG: hypothetical protein ACTHP8_12200 [Bosea sp. (in: a-proteobacteria)]|uniref:hypothetical protein n=1 Tax=unclassified Bosea (in: a-proteobacteria) TaxID=2653178 RepID=UPI000963D858|nr:MULTISPECIES: hypothetical protein [unclassified Bosea (in: a-proteobacteria)]MBN9445076.1 hypothetical protein [Bosea sp. (in: a-proteobacteria)]MBN9456329.1 hypothetical protein [Bosea sp. (in: a-proteobacteria)]OJV05378.1 MAG: hypothetical protein BGO20_13855 [Bosea sp. 67-29]
MREIAFGLLLAAAIVVTAFLAAMWPEPGRPLVAFFPAGSSARAMSEAVARAGGSLLDIDTGSATITTIADDAGFPTALYRSGAWLVLDGSVAQLCARFRRWRT